MILDDLKGKTVLVTGASTGIGAAVARGFGAQGMFVGVHCNASRTQADRVAADVAAAGGRAVVLQADLSRRGAAARLIADAAKALGGIDILVNNAGAVVRRVAIKDADDALYDAVLDLNIRAVFEGTRAAIPLMEARGRGNIITTSSLAARTGGGGGSILYAGAKAFVSTFTRGLAKELAGKNIRVNAVAPGVIMTPLQDRSTPPEQIAAAIAATPMKRTATAEECVGTYLYLASDAASGFVTGQVIEVNGGLNMP